MEHKHGFKLRIVTLFMVLVLLFSIPYSSAAWTLDETRNYAYSGSSVTVELDPGVYEITLKGAKGHSPSKVDSRDSVGVGGAGGYIKINYTVVSAMNVTLWIAGQGGSGSGGWGRTSGVAGPYSLTPGGGGSTEIWKTSPSGFIAAADGGGGARGGSGGDATRRIQYDGYSAGGSGYGGDGADITSTTAQNGGAGGQNAASGITVLSSSTGGSDTGGNGYITIKLIELPPVEEEVLNPLFFGGGI